MIRGLPVNYTTCEKACAFLKTPPDGLPTELTYTLKYFRCYATENGNIEKYSSFSSANNDVICTPSILFYLMSQS